MSVPTTQEALLKLHCRPLPPGQGKLTPPEVDRGLSMLPGWTAEHGRLSKRYALDDFRQTMVLVNAIAAIADAEEHHPDLSIGYNRCKVEWSTHSAGGITLNDVICAAKTHQKAVDLGARDG